MEDYGYSQPQIFTQQPDSFVAPAVPVAVPVAVPPVAPMQSVPVIATPDQLPIPQPADNIFADTGAGKDLDVTSIITKRLNAMRKLQENPMDSEAITLMYRTQKDVSN